MLSLHDAIVQSQSSPQAREGADQQEAAQGALIQAGLRPNPRLYLSSEDWRPGASDFSFVNDTEDYAYLGQQIELGGKRARRLDLAQANLKQAASTRTLLDRQIAARVAVAYWTAVANAGIAKLLADDIQAVDEIVRYNQARVDAGAMRGVDLIRTQIERDRLLLALETARREVVLSRIELFRQIGRSDQPGVVLSDPIDTTTPIEIRTITDVLASRADLAVAEDAVAAAKADVRLQQASGIPDLDLLAGYKRNSQFNSGYTSLQIPLVFRNRNQGEVARAEGNLRLANDKLEQLKLSIAADVTSAQQDYEHQLHVVRDILPDMRARARQNLTIMDDAYRTGGVDLLRYLDAERVAFDVEVSALRTLSAFRQAGLRLELAYGVQP